MEDTTFSYQLELVFIPLNYWSWILAIFGFAAKYLNKANTKLTYANEAVYPFYILHQTILMIIGFYIKDLNLSFIIKFSMMIFGTFFVSWFLYEFFIRRWMIIRPLFGLKRTLR